MPISFCTWLYYGVGRQAVLGQHRVSPVFNFEFASRSPFVPRRHYRVALLLGVVACCALALCGCGGVVFSSTAETLQFSPALVSFGDVEVGTSANDALSISNPWVSSLTVASFAVSGPGFSLAPQDPAPLVIAPGKSQRISIVFAPQADGDFSGQLAALDKAGKTLAVAQMRGTGRHRQYSRLTVSTSNVNFGNVALNSLSTQSVTLTSSGSGSLTINSASVIGTDFSLSQAFAPVTLNPGQSVVLKVNFSPKVAGLSTGQIVVSSNSTTGATTSVSLSGTGTAAATPQLTVSSASLGFGSVTVNTTVTKALTLTSSGTAPVTVNSLALTGSGFSSAGAAFPLTLNPGTSASVQVTFDPTVAGALTGQIVVSSNSTTGATTSVSLSGTGTAAATPQLTVSSASLSFGSVPIGSPTTQALTLTSSGTSPVTVSAASLTGAGFTVTGATFPVTLNPAVAITLQVQFNPTAAVTSTGTITISSNSTTGSPIIVSLSGTGTAVQHQVSLVWSAPASSPDPVSSYNIYRSSGGSSYQRINTSVETQTTYVDLAVQAGTTYGYYVKSVDSAGTESTSSNQVTVTVP